VSGKPRLLLVDDHHMVLEGLRLELEPEFEIVGMLANGGQVVEQCRKLAPDLVLLDLSLPDRGGLEVIGDVRQARPDQRILIVTMHRDRILSDACLQSGASGFIPKDADAGELRTAIREVLAGRRYVSPLVPDRPQRFSSMELAFPLAQLTPRQQTILRLLGEGKSTACIAAELHLSPNTVTFHRVRIRKALGIPSEWALLKYALMVKLEEGPPGLPLVLNRAPPRRGFPDGPPVPEGRPDPGDPP
jgi:DNA-binding NarL/FixJ family response regulator